jgi:hypothetical protein
MNDAIRREALRIEEDCIYSSKGHFNSAEFWARIHLWIGIPTAVLSAIASGSAFQNLGQVAGSLAIIVTALTAVATFLDPNQRAAAHRTAGNQYLSLRNLTRIFRELEIENGAADDLKARITQLAANRDSLNEACPSIPTWAYKAAKAGIESGEGAHQVDKEKTQ